MHEDRKMTKVASHTAEPDARWESLRNRDKSSDGAFVYGVATTRIYCRPGCPSRLPRRENVRFFVSAEEAEMAGFQPCKRCRPDGISIEQRQAEAIAKACALIEASEEKPNFDEVARAVGMSRHHFHHVFKEKTGLTPGAYLGALRKRRALVGLGKGLTATETIYNAGYSSSGRFYEQCAPALGLKPKSFRRGGAGEVIRFAVGECSLGSILVAATERGICAIELADAPEPLVEDLQHRFRNASFIGGDTEFERIIAQVVAFVDDPKRGFDLPLHIRGTAFQETVWRVLREIPLGETMTYAEVAAKVGCPRAVRAVANAIASNRLAVAIPCHRVVRTGGALSGYRWGVERKARLLKSEGVF
jgi:AraC family transcriptional regulator, regulatory protein of adaptative response / methylated-DNA-[protein]-cysteine methyltransferase